MKYVVITNGVITTIFGSPQKNPPPGYSEIADNDPRIVSSALADAQSKQISILTAACNASKATPVTYTSKAGVTASYACDQPSITLLSESLHGCAGAAATPAGFEWPSVTGQETAFTYADLQGLAGVIFTQSNTLMLQLKTLKLVVMASTTIQAVQAVTWG